HRARGLAHPQQDHHIVHPPHPVAERIEDPRAGQAGYVDASGGSAHAVTLCQVRCAHRLERTRARTRTLGGAAPRCAPERWVARHPLPERQLLRGKRESICATERSALGIPQNAAFDGGRVGREGAAGAAETSGGEGREHGTEVTPTRREETIAVCQQCARPTRVRGPSPAVTRSPSTRPTWRPSAPSTTSPITSSPSMP